MQVNLSWEGVSYQADLSAPISIALPLKPDASSTRAWNAPSVRLEPVEAGDWVGSVKQGAPVNFMNLRINPHGNGTHTETLGHIVSDWEENTILSLLPNVPFLSTLHTVPTNELANGDLVVDFTSLRQNPPRTPGVILRVLGEKAQDIDFSNQNPPYFNATDLSWLAAQGVQHLITDLPSVDREIDGGALAGHHAWWCLPDTPRREATITELAKLNQPLADGLYLVGLHALPLAADASPSHPLIYPLLSSND
ncbi:MAG: cyclase family protein [Saprospiraceae bacterium]